MKNSRNKYGARRKSGYSRGGNKNVEKRNIDMPQWSIESGLNIATRFTSQSLNISIWFMVYELLLRVSS